MLCQMAGHGCLPMVFLILMVRFDISYVLNNKFLIILCCNVSGLESDRQLTPGKVYTVKVMLDAIGKTC